MKNSLTDKISHQLSNAAYDISKGKIKKDKMIIQDKFKVLAVEDNKNNGMQAMAVAPVDRNGNVNTGEIVIAYAGTDIFSLKDLNTDGKQVVLGKRGINLDNYLENVKNLKHQILPSAVNKFTVDATIADTNYLRESQVVTAEKFADKIKKEYPYSKISSTGHSLGGFLASYIAIINKWSTTVYNAPDSSKLLNEEQIKWALEHPERLKNFRNPLDWIGNHGGDKLGMAIYVDNDVEHHGALTPSFFYSMFSKYHGIETWDKFDSEGYLLDINGKRVERTYIKELDVENDGKIDFKINSIDLMPENFFPLEYIKKVNDSVEIIINNESLELLLSRLNNAIADLEKALEILNSAEKYNNELSSKKESRKETLGQYVVNNLRQIQVVDMIEKIDKFFSDLESNKDKYNEFAGYEGSYFKVKFSSQEGSKTFITADGNDFDYIKIRVSLDGVGETSQKVFNDFSRVDEDLSQSSGRGEIIMLPVRSRVGKMGESVINSFDEKIRNSFKGENNRSGFDDGIVDALKELIQVEKKNIETVIKSFEYMVSAVEILKSSVNKTDSEIGLSLKDGKQVQAHYQAPTLSKNYDSFLKDSQVFDDVAVVKAFDNQVDTRTKELSDEMKNKLSNYLQYAGERMKKLFDSIRENKNYSEKTVAEYPTQIFYKENKGKDRDNEKKYYGSVESEVQKASGIKDLVRIGNELVENNQATLARIQPVYSNLSYLSSLLKNSLEEQIYGYNNLNGILKAHHFVRDILSKINDQASEFNSFLSQNKGLSINKADERLNEILNITNNVNTMIKDCFGEN